MLLDFIEYLQKNTSLSERSINHYESGLRVVSQMMLELNVIDKPLEEMGISELEIAIFFILQNTQFKEKDSIGKRMYSNSLKHYQAFAKNSLEYNSKSIIDKIKKDNSIPETEKITIIKARKGQGKFRNLLLKKYGKCIITGIDDERILMASHIKPWSVSNNKDRIDVENGLLLSPLYDKMFDYGLMTFTNDGQIRLSTTIKKNNLFIMNIDTNTLFNLQTSPKLIENLDYHRDVVFLR